MFGALYSASDSGNPQIPSVANKVDSETSSLSSARMQAHPVLF